MPHSRQGSHSGPRRAEGVLFDASNQGNLFPNDACALKKKYYIRIESFMV